MGGEKERGKERERGREKEMEREPGLLLTHSFSEEVSKGILGLTKGQYPIGKSKKSALCFTFFLFASDI